METLEYSNGEITILWKPKACIHSGICVKTLPQVYDPKARPWIRPENSTTRQLVDQVTQCPSGALSIKELITNNETKS
ncbi:(4Fe-4S)-binding protein [Mucilaginibacter pedocola]|uniref:(4Fe-4S)-binding protein n=1 Tax=Mucilaginibacter pedocola TaxID=1792845 RepID=UPI000993B07C|nr:(4Fe-4S)-binding protein [Mucilaginibacter pedocola]